MALRERMLSHEKMHYHEAVTRINKYRQRLKQRAVLPPSKSDNNIINDIQAWKEILERNKTKAPANEAPGARMSPTKEWKPLIVTDNDDEKGQKVPPFFGKTPSELPKKPTPHHSNARGNKIASAAAKRAGAHPSQSESVKGNYPVHGEALLKTANAEKAASTSNDETSLPNIASPSRTGFHMTDPTKLPGSGPKNARRSNKAENRQQDDAEKTRTLINSLKQLKVTSGGENSMVTAGTDRSSTAPPSKPPPPTRDHASKLRLLMQSSSQAQRDADDAGGGRSRRSAGATKITGSRMGSRRAVNRRPITQPHALGGDGTLPKIHNIISSALLKSGKLLDAVDRPQVKHRLTLNGVAKRDAFATNVLGIAKKHQRAAAADARVVDDDVIPSPTTDAALSLAVTNDKHDQTTQQMPNNNVKNSAKQQPADSKPGKSWKKNGGLAQRIYNPLYVQHKSMASKPNMHVNPQHSSLQLVSSTASMDDAAAGQTSQPTSPSRASRADGYSPTTADRRSTTRTRGRKRAAKQKVMRVSVVEPPQTALERQRRQMEIEMSSRRLAMNPAHAAVSNFTTAVLNSELALRAPSSSPVDMYMRELYINNLDGAGEDWAEMQRHERRSAEQFHQSMAQFQPHPQHSDYRMMINNTDGLNLPIPNVISSRHDISRLFSRHHKQPTVEEATPKIKDYVGLQRLYNAMKKHGDHRPGAVYHYSAASPASLMKASSAPLEMHALTRTHHTRRSQRGASEPPIKTPYYYNPYKGYSDPIQVNPAPFAEDAVYGAGGGPLYAVVTGAAEFPAPTAVATPNSMGQQRRHHHAYPGKYEAVGVAPAPVGGAGKHEITIMMPDTSAVLVQHTPHLEKIKEHVTN